MGIATSHLSNSFDDISEQGPVSVIVINCPINVDCLFRAKSSVIIL